LILFWCYQLFKFYIVWYMYPMHYIVQVCGWIWYLWTVPISHRGVICPLVVHFLEVHSRSLSHWWMLISHDLLLWQSVITTTVIHGCNSVSTGSWLFLPWLLFRLFGWQRSITPYRISRDMEDRKLRVLAGGNTFHKRSVSSPAPVTMLWPSGDTARYNTLYEWPVKVATGVIDGYFQT